MINIIHVGANKTASTLFQKHVFSCLPHVFYIGEDSKEFKNPLEINQALINFDQVAYSNTIHNIEQFFKPRNLESLKIKLFSSEDIMGSKFPSVPISRLAQLMPDAKLVVVLRNQLTAWPSWYRSHGSMLKNVPKSYWRRYVNFEDWSDYCFSFPLVSPCWAMNYWEHIKIFQNYFDKENIKIILYEDFQHKPLKFLREWAEILEISVFDLQNLIANKKERQARSDFEFKIHSVLKNYNVSKSIYNQVSFLDPFFKTKKTNLSKNVMSRVNDFYKDGNRRLQKEFNIDLQSYDYPL